MFQLKYPFGRGPDEEIQRRSENCPPDLSDMPPDLPAAKDLITKLLVVDPELRLQKVTTHELFRSVAKTTPFKPIPPKEGAEEARKVPEYFADDPLVYEYLESVAIRIPPTEYFASEYYKSIQ